MLKKFFKDSFVYGLSNVISRGIALFLLPLYTRVNIFASSLRRYRYFDHRGYPGEPNSGFGDIPRGYPPLRGSHERERKVSLCLDGAVVQYGYVRLFRARSLMVLKTSKLVDLGIKFFASHFSDRSTLDVEHRHLLFLTEPTPRAVAAQVLRCLEYSLYAGLYRNGGCLGIGF